MSFKSIVRAVKEKRKHWSNQPRSDIVPAPALYESPIEQGKWANLPPKLLSNIFHRVEEEASSWPGIVLCASVCKSWREIIIKEIVKAPKECGGRLTFPVSLKQPTPCESLIQCYVKRDKASSVYRLYFGTSPSEDKRDKLLLAAKRIIRATSVEYVISLVAQDFSQASNTYAGKLRSNLLGTKFTIYDSQPRSVLQSFSNNTVSLVKKEYLRATI